MISTPHAKDFVNFIEKGPGHVKDKAADLNRQSAAEIAK